MQRTRVLQIITGFIPGGAERLLLDMMQQFDPARFQVELLSIVDDLRALQVYGYPQQPVEVFDLSGRDKLRTLRRMRTHVHAFEPDVIHAHMFHSLVAALLCRPWRNPPALCFTSHNSSHAGARAALLRALRRTRDADIVFDPLQHPLLNAANTWVIPNGVPVPAQAPERQPWQPGGGARLLAVGRLVPAKDPLGLLRSFARVRTPGVTLEFVGSGPLEASAKAFARQAGVAERVRFSGFCSDVRARMRDNDILVIHSNTEGMPMALLEAGAEAMPVVATPVGSIPLLLQSGRGWVTSTDKFADTLDAVLAAPQTAVAAGRKLHAHVLEKNSLAATTRLHENLYASLAAGSHVAEPQLKTR